VIKQQPAPTPMEVASVAPVLLASMVMALAAARTLMNARIQRSLFATNMLNAPTPKEATLVEIVHRVILEPAKVAKILMNALIIMVCVFKGRLAITQTEVILAVIAQKGLQAMARLAVQISMNVRRRMEDVTSELNVTILLEVAFAHRVPLALQEVVTPLVLI